MGEGEEAAAGVREKVRKVVQVQVTCGRAIRGWRSKGPAAQGVCHCRDGGTGGGEGTGGGSSRGQKLWPAQDVEVRQQLWLGALLVQRVDC